MKKIALAVAMVLTLGMLASCKFETTSKDYQSYEYVGTVAGTIKSTATTIRTPGTKDKDGKFVATEGAKVETTSESTEKKPTSYTISYSENVNSNYTEYTITLYDKDYNYIEQVKIHEIGDKYYLGSKDVTSAVTGSPDGNFTYKFTTVREESETVSFGTSATQITLKYELAYNLTFTVSE